MELSALEAPSWLAAAARANWDRVPDDPKVGDVWVLTWSGEAKALVLVTKVADGYVLVMPITDDSPSSLEAALSSELLGRELALWARLETGVGLHLLHRRLGRVLDDDQVGALRLWGQDALGEPPLQVGSGQPDPDTQRRVLTNINTLCFTEWPDERDAVLNVDALGVTAMGFADRTGLTVSRVLELWDSQPLDATEVRLIADAFGIESDEFLVTPKGDLFDEMRRPAYKDLLVRVGLAAQLDEADVRRRARSEYALAARTDSSTTRQATRLRDTLTRMLSAADDATER